MDDLVENILVKIDQADQVIKAASEVSIFKQECMELRFKTEKLLTLLCKAAHFNKSNYPYERPTRRIIEDTEHVLEEATVLVFKCGLVKSFFTTISVSDFRKMGSQLENVISDVSWLLHVSGSGNGDYLGLPAIAANEPILFIIWEQIALLNTGSFDDRSDAAASLVSLDSGNDSYRKLIIEEGGVGPLLKLVKDGNLEGQENAARAIGLLGRDRESMEKIIHAGVCSVFAEILREGAMKVQAVVAWAVSELAGHFPECQYLFAQHNVVRLLVRHLAFETIQQSLLEATNKARETEEPATKVYMKAMTARAIQQLAKGNSAICRNITASRALLCLAVLLEKGPSDVQFNCAMALMEITAVAEVDHRLRRSAFSPSSRACKAVVDQLLRIIEEADPKLLIPCVNAIGNLARTFRATETRMISSLVRLLYEREDEVARAGCIALIKFASSENYLHTDHCKSIIRMGGVEHLTQLVYFGEQIVQSCAFELLCHIALHVPDSDELAQAEVLTVIEWALKQGFIIKNGKMDYLSQAAQGKLELHQSGGSRILYI